MTEDEKELLKEGLKFLDDALARIMEIKDEPAKALANILHGALVFGEHIDPNMLKQDVFAGAL